jgi:hypothetical protein
MSSYLVYAISYCHIFEDLPRARNVDFSKDPVQLWYLTLWKHKAPYHFYEVHNAFLSSFKKLVHGPTTSRLSMEVASFLAGKGVFETLDDFSYIRLYDFQGKPSLLPFYVSNKLFTIEVCKQYKFWAHFFNEKRKKQFIPLPWRIGEIIVKISLIWMNLLFILIILS